MEVVDFEAGEIILINKPREWTSFDVVAKIRNHLKLTKIGHAGTLDPLATGLLILCTGARTKEINAIQDADKQYVAEITFGAVTDSYDAECPPRDIRDTSHLTPETVQEALAHFTGTIAQVPPTYSAIKVDGKRAYKLARKGKAPELKARSVMIHAIELLDMELAVARLHIHCQKGTYIRSLAHDLGQHLGTGAYLSGLVRTAIGHYKLADAQTLEDFLHKHPKRTKTPH
ncbi:MAG: tRNA pseudouridine(55) synthase TruB [Bacteroidetes bacterium]|nr:tRNA pseudouridine(55) synthase TruB [Bacteroidota bacterium]